MSIKSLTALNQQLIAQVDTEGPVDLIPDDTGLELDYGDPNETDTKTKEEVRGRFHLENPLDFQRIREFIEENIFLGEATGQTGQITAFIDEWAEDLQVDTSKPFPSAEAFFNNQDFLTGASFLPVRAQLDLLPKFFRTETMVDGEVVPVMVVNSPLKGPQFIVEQPVETLLANLPTAKGPITTHPAQVQQTGPFAVTRQDEASEAPDRPTVNPFIGVIENSIRTQRANMPFFTEDALMAALQPRTTSTGTGSGGGRTLEFDRNQLVAQVTDLYNNWMLDPNLAPPALVGSIVDSYIREAKAFWSGKGAQLDFDTYVRESLRKQPRWANIYKYKTPQQSEEEFLASFQQPIAGLGQTAEFTRGQTEAAVMSGAGPGEQLERVSRTREVQQGGGFSRRLAATLQGLGPS